MINLFFFLNKNKLKFYNHQLNYLLIFKIFFNMKLLLILLFPFTLFAQTDCEKKSVTYSLQLFSTKDVQLFDASHIDSTDTFFVEEVCVKGEKRFRILIPQESELNAYDAKNRYSPFFKDCFIVKYIDGKRYN